MTSFRSTVTALALLLLSGGIAQAQAQAPQAGGMLTIALNSDIRSLDSSRRDGNTDSILHHIYETLVAHRADMSVGPLLAQSWDISPDGKVYTFKLREGASYHNGDAVKAADLKWVWDRRMATRSSAQNLWFCIPYFDGSQGLKVEAIETPDDRTIVFRIDEPNALFLTLLANPACNIWAASPKNVDAEGKWLPDTAIGSGPFQLKEWKKERHVLLERFAGYKPSAEKTSGYAGARLVHVDSVRFMVIPDKSAAEAALLAGQVDVLPSVAAQQMEEIRKRGGGIVSAPGLAFSAILMQTNDPLLSDVRMRKAIIQAIDLKQIAETKTNGLADFNPSGVAQSSAYFDESFLNWPKYDPAASKALLKEAGYRGQVLKMQTNARYPGMYENAVIVQAMLSAVGIKVELDVLDWSAQLENYLSGKFQLQSFGYSALADPSLRYGSFVGDKAAKPSTQWENKAAFDLFVRSKQVGGFEERKAIFRQMHALMLQDLPIQGLYYNPVIDAVSAKTVGYEPWPADKPRAWGVWKKK